MTSLAARQFLRVSTSRLSLPRPALSVCQDRRWLSRKGSKMGQHLVNLDALAHRESHRIAEERRKAKKEKQQQRLTGKAPVAQVKAESDVNDDEEMKFDENDSHFDHGDDDAPALPDPEQVRERMKAVVAKLTESFKAIRGSEPTPDIFDPITVYAYGERTPLSAVAQVVIVGPTLATVTCFDPQLGPDVRNAIRDMLDLNPQLEGDDGLIQVPLPRVSAETRQKTVQQLGRQAEAGRQRIRRIRRAALEVVKKGKDGKLEGISKDDAFRVSKEIDTVTDEVTKILNDEVEMKQRSVMAD